MRLDVSIVRRGIEALLADPSKGRYFVACHEKTPVGQLMHTWEWSDWRNGHIWWLQSVYVEPQFRRQGVFRRLYEYSLNQALADREVVGIRLYVERENGRAQETYRRLGMIDTGYFVMQNLFG